MEISINLGGQTPNYAMYTDLGNAAVHAIVQRARADKMNWIQTCNALQDLAELEQFSEATDTIVRECVYDTLEFSEEFYF